MDASRPFTFYFLVIADILTIFLIGIYIYKYLKNPVKNYTNTIGLFFNLFCLIYAISTLTLELIKDNFNLAQILAILGNMSYRLTINWATVLAVFTYGVLNADGPFAFKFFMARSIIVSITLAGFCYFMIDRLLPSWTYLSVSLDMIVMTVPIIIIHVKYSKAHKLVTSGEFGTSIFADTSASKILWYSRITFICLFPKVITDVLILYDLYMEKGSNSVVTLFLNYNLKKVFYSVWALLNLWVDWSVMRVYRERAISLVEWRNSKAMSINPFEDDLERTFDGL